jgi:hypothetical protein
LSDVSSADEHEEDEAAAAAAANDIATIERQQPEQQQQHQPQLHGTQIKLMGVHLRNIGVIECSLLSLLIECKRCRTKVEWKSIRPYSDADGQCEKCKTELRLRYSPALAYPGNEVVGTVDTDQCLAVELLRSTFQPTCSECTPPEGEDSSSPVTQMEMQAHPCMPPILACFPCVQCHARMEFGFSGVRFTRLGRQDGLFSSSHSNRRNNAVDEQQQSVRRRKNKQPREPGIVPGQPLPDKGTCSHYKKSFRWLRFPCWYV